MNAPPQKMAVVRQAFHGDKSDFMAGEKVLCRPQPGGRWIVMKVSHPDGDIAQMDVMVDVPGECLQF